MCGALVEAAGAGELAHAEGLALGEQLDEAAGVVDGLNLLDGRQWLPLGFS